MGLAGLVVHAHHFTSHLACHGSFLAHLWILSKGTSYRETPAKCIRKDLVLERIRGETVLEGNKSGGDPGGRDKGEEDAVDPL